MVTGGCGFIGCNFVRHMLATYKDVEVVNLDALTYAGSLENLRDVEGDKRYRFVKGDVCDPAAVNSAMEGADAVVHFAAESAHPHRRPRGRRRSPRSQELAGACHQARHRVPQTTLQPPSSAKAPRFEGSVPIYARSLSPTATCS